MNFTVNINELWFLIFLAIFFKTNIRAKIFFLFCVFLFWNWKWKFMDNIFQDLCIHYECRKLRLRKGLIRTLSNIYDGAFLNGTFNCLVSGHVFLGVVVLRTINRCEKTLKGWFPKLKNSESSKFFTLAVWNPKLKNLQVYCRGHWLIAFNLSCNRFLILLKTHHRNCFHVKSMPVSLLVRLCKG